MSERNHTVLVTGGAGFIGSCFVLQTLRETDWTLVNLDKLTYAGNPENLAEVEAHPRYRFEHGDIADPSMVARVFREHDPDAVLHFAAESHVDRSIDSAAEFVRTNVLGTQVLLDASRAHLSRSPTRRTSFRFVHVSTDEVFGSLGAEGRFTETSPFAPSSPYAASKAAADHLVRAAFKTHGLCAISTHCGNNFGPRQFPEKLIPLMILTALEGKPLPVYGDGLNVRDWVYVDDHCRALRAVLERGRPGQSYMIGASQERTNLEVVRVISRLLDELAPVALNANVQGRGLTSYSDLLSFVADRPGHDRRYAIDPSLLGSELGWKPAHTFESGMRETVEWYLKHKDWCQRITEGSYKRERLGLAKGSAE